MLSFTYNYLFLFFIIFLTIKSNDYYFNFNKLLFVASLFLHLFLTIIFIKLFPTSDWETYVWNSGFFFENEFSTSAFFSTFLITNISIIFSKYLFLNQINIILIFSLISFFGVILFVHNLIKLGFEKKYASFLLFIPTIHFWTGTPGKDSVILFALSCFFNLYIDKKIFLSVIFIILAFLVRPHIGMIFLISIVLTEILLIKNFHHKLAFLLFSSVIVFTLLTSYRTETYFLSSEGMLSDNIFLQMLNQLHNLSIKYALSGSAYEGGNMISNIISYVLFPIKFIFQNNSPSINILMVIETFTLIIIIFLITKSNSSTVVDKRLIYFLSICLLIYLCVLPQVFFNYGINLRQKWMILPFLIYLSFLLRNLFVKINKI